MKNVFACCIHRACSLTFAASILLLATHNTHLHAEADYPFKRVFTTEAEREVIDKIRLQPQNSEQLSQINATASVPSITFSGVHIGTNGKHLVWVNGKSSLSKTPPDTTLKTSRPTKKTGSARIYNDGKSTRLKPGQVWLINSNEVQEGYEIRAPEAQPTPAPLEQKADTPDVVKTLKALKEINAQ